MWGENVCFRIDEVWEPILEVSVTNFEIALHMEETGCPPNWEAKGWGKRNRPWGSGRAPWHFESRLISRRGLSALCPTSGMYTVPGSMERGRLTWPAPNQHTSMICWGGIFLLCETGPYIIRRDQTRMRRPNIKDIKMRQNGNRISWISDSLSQWKPPWLEVLSRGTSTQ